MAVSVEAQVFIVIGRSCSEGCGSASYSISPSPLLEQLHWLPIDLRIAFKIATITFKTLNLGQSEYLGNVIKRHVLGRAL